MVAWVGSRSDERAAASTTGPASATRHPAAALAMTLFLLSLGGIPPTAGFFGKFYVFRAAIEEPASLARHRGLLNSAVSLYYYLRVVVAMYFRDPLRPHDPYPSASMRAALVITAAATLLLGLFPSTVVSWAGAVTTAAVKVAGL